MGRSGGSHGIAFCEVKSEVRTFLYPERSCSVARRPESCRGVACEVRGERVIRYFHDIRSLCSSGLSVK